MKKTIILLTGKAGSGKDTTAEIMCDLYPDTVHRKLAHPLVSIMSVMFPGFTNYYEHEMIEQPNSKNLPHEVFKGRSYRECMIWMAEECIKPKFGKDFFINNLLDRIDRDGSEFTIVSDLGFKNDELYHIDHNKYNVFVVKIDRDEVPDVKDSRQVVDENVFYTINNNGTYEQLKDECMYVMSLIKNRLEG